ncbi:MAG: penicillin-binding protein 2 [Fervidobacterium sp.]|uniref:peptidoglycan D,D-transpeptidase FtsI family protein n=1 Tax=Fervidobacterium sp. TaxID=1871331 RepID=UPI0025B9BB26|nr:penicillin-binding protein 2 [Fervidobacterium sp.]NPU89615.1 penicillin-binding protein 2 [Fervidobacterium sp.]
MRRSKYRYRLVLLTVSVLIIILLVKVYTNIYTNRYAVKSYVPALRGNIYDSRGRLLATSEIVYGVYLDLNYLRSFAGNAFKKSPDFLRLLNAFGASEQLSELDKKNILRLGIVNSRQEAIKKIPTQFLKFVAIVPEERRISLSDFGLSAIVGKTDQRHGISGVEAYFDKILRPIRDGVVSVTYSGIIGRPLNYVKIEPENGKNVRITIDSELQRQLYLLAQDYKAKKQATEVGVLVMESNTGKVRAALTTQSWPTYYMGYIEPGSTIKPIIFSAALELGLVTPNTNYYCPGYVKPIEDLNLTIKDLEVHKDINLYDGLVHSCNVVSIFTTKKIIDSFGIEKLYEIFQSFGFGRETGIELQGEIPGKLNPPDKWYKADWAFMGIGQSIGVTPIQLLAAFNTIVNDGIYVTPTIDEGKEVTKKRVISKATADIVKQMLEDVVERGTGINAKIDGVKILGKTGTAQKNQKKDVAAVFVGQAILDKPYTIMVWVDSPQTEKLSSIVAAPFFKEVVLKLKQYQDDLINPKKPSYTTLPDITGWNISQLKELAESTSVVLKLNGTGLYVEKYATATTSDATNVTVVEVWLTDTPITLKHIVQ